MYLEMREYKQKLNFSSLYCIQNTKEIYMGKEIHAYDKPYLHAP